MKQFKQFIGEAKNNIKVGDKVKSKGSFASTKGVKGEVVDVETVKFASGDQVRYKVKEPDGSVTDLRADDIVKESTITEASDKAAKVMFQSALKARDAQVEIVKATHPLSKGKYMIKVYSSMTDPNVVFYADVIDFRADYMS